MITILESINEVITYNNFINIDNEIITEKLQEPHLQQLAKYLSTKDTNSRETFKHIFGDLRLPWDKITTSDFKEFSAGDNAGIKMAKAILKNDNSYQRNITLLLTDDDEIEYLIYGYGIVKFNNGRTEIVDKWNKETQQYDSVERAKRVENKYDIKQKDITELCKQYNMLILDTTKLSKEIDDLRSKRYKANNGVIHANDMYEMKKLAEENIERYRKIISKRKAEKLAQSDDIIKRINDVIQKAMQLSQKFYEKPEDYADISMDLSNLLKLIYDQERSSAWNTGKDRYKRYGKQGLLITLNNYLSTHKDVKKGTDYSFQINDYKKQKTALEDLIKEANALIDKIETKMK